MFPMRTCNYAVALAGLCLGAAIMAAAATFPLGMTDQGPGPGFWPFLLGVAMVVSAIILTVYTVLHRLELSGDKVQLMSEANRQVYAMMGLIGAFALLIPLLGFYPAALLLVPCVMYRLGCRNRLWMAGTAAGTVIFIYVVFGLLLHTVLPSSMFLQ